MWFFNPVNFHVFKGVLLNLIVNPSWKERVSVLDLVVKRSQSRTSG
jgi:hypothetical protein